MDTPRIVLFMFRIRIRFNMRVRIRLKDRVSCVECYLGLGCSGDVVVEIFLHYFS